MDSRTRFVSIALGFLLTATTASGQVFDEEYDHWPEDLRIAGTVVAGSDLDAGIIQEFLTAQDAESSGAIFHGADADALLQQLAPRLVGAGDQFTTAKIDAGFAAQWEKVADTLDLLILLRIGDAALMTQMAPKLQSIIERGGTIVCDGAAAAVGVLGALTVDGQRGANLVPDCVLTTGYRDAPEARGKLLSVLSTHPRMVGIGVEQGSAIVLSGRKVRVVGGSKATVMLMANERQPVRIQTLSARRSPDQAQNEFLIDLTQWRRDAIDRTLAPFPPANPRAPNVENGALVIVGGGRMPDGLMDTFIELAGGRDQARLVFIPCEERKRDALPAMLSTVKGWERSGVVHATFIHTKDRRQANTDEAFLAPLKDATGIWFGGGRQWNFADSYYGTKAHQLMKEVLRRGGVIGGSSAGASVQARYLARATPIGNFRIMAPGYERGGLGFLSGVAIDQHFSQRGRQKDMTELMNHHPQLLGIGIDESTALIVSKSTAKIVGSGRAHFYDRTLPARPDEPDHTALAAGVEYDLAGRQVIETRAEPIDAVND